MRTRLKTRLERCTFDWEGVRGYGAVLQEAAVLPNTTMQPHARTVTIYRRLQG